MKVSSCKMPKKIMFNIYGLDHGGPELRLLDFAMNFQAELEVHICVTSNNLSLLNDFRKSRARIFIVPIARPHLELWNVKKILSYIRRNEIEILNSFDLKGLFVSAIAKACSSKRIKLVHHFIQEGLHVRNRRNKLGLEAFVRAADFLICNSDAVKNEVRASGFGDGRVSVIYNGVDSERFSPNGERRTVDRGFAGLDKEHFVLGTVANFRTEKNYPFLIDQFRELSEAYPRLRLLCVGGGPLLDDIRSMVQKYQLDRKVILTGFVDDVRKYLAMMDAFTLCSLKEGFPNALLQAMSMGLPVVCSAVGECGHIITDGKTGLLFDSCDGEMFRKAVARIMENKNLGKTLSKAARDMVQERFSLNRMIQNYSDFFLRV